MLSTPTEMSSVLSGILNLMDELVIEGKKLISSKRAAELTGYARDYVGQLVRMGRVSGRRVGRAWYVDEEELRFHKNSESAISSLQKGVIGQIDEESGKIVGADESSRTAELEPAPTPPDPSTLGGEHEETKHSEATINISPISYDREDVEIADGKREYAKTLKDFYTEGGSELIPLLRKMSAAISEEAMQESSTQQSSGEDSKSRKISANQVGVFANESRGEAVVSGVTTSPLVAVALLVGIMVITFLTNFVTTIVVKSTTSGVESYRISATIANTEDLKAIFYSISQFR